MCYSAEISLNTFIFGTISLLILYYNNNIDKSNLIILYSFTSIQLLEYFAWTYIDNKKILSILSIIGIFIIIFQIIIIIYFTNKKYRNILYILYIIFISILMYKYLLNCNKNVKLYMEKGSNGHLIWYWLNIHFIFIIIGILFYIIPFYLNNKYYQAFLAFITAIISLYYYYNYNTFGTMWCYISNFLWIILLIKSYYLLYIKYQK